MERSWYCAKEVGGHRGDQGALQVALTSRGGISSMHLQEWH